MLIGLIFPAIIFGGLLSSLTLALAIKASVGLALVLVLTATMASFLGATALMLRLSDLIVRFARVRARRSPTGRRADD